MPTLLIDSGYYPWYGSPHDVQWTRQTLAHNAILFNGKGQGVWRREAQGHITAFATSEDFHYVAADATTAYQQPSRPFAKTPLELCAHDQGVQRAVRHVVFVRPNVLVILDDLATEEPASIQFLLHAWNSFEFDNASRTAAITNAPARAKIWWLGSESLSLSQ